MSIALVQPQSAEWHQERQGGIGSSDAPIVVGLGYDKTPRDLFELKRGLTQPEDLTANEYIYWGHVHEDNIAARFRSEHPELEVRRWNAAVWSDRWHFAFAHPDRRIRDSAGNRLVLEIKTAGVNAAKDWGASGTTDIPDYYLPQVMHEIAVEDAIGAWVAVLIGGNEYREYYIPRNDTYIVWLMEQERIFWTFVEENVPPPPIHRADVERAFPKPEGTIETTTEISEAIKRLVAVKEQIAQLDTEQQNLNNEIALAFGDADTLTLNGQKLATFFAQTRNGTDQKALAAAYPEIAAQFPTKTTFRVLRLSKAK